MRRALSFLLACSSLPAAAQSAAAQSIERVSVDSSGAQGDLMSLTPGEFSADGRFVVFNSRADNLVANDTNYSLDVFVRDRATGTTERVSVDSSGAEGNGDSFWPAISADGRYVAFGSSATNLVAGDANHATDVFVHDRVTGSTVRVSVDSAGNPGNLDSYDPAISGDGRFVAFSSAASNLVPGDANNRRDTFVHDQQTGTTERVSVDSSGTEADNDSMYAASISTDGSFVVFASNADNLVSGDTNLVTDVFLHDRQAGTTERISVDSSGVANYGPCDIGVSAVSDDGRFVTFWSYSLGTVYARDRQNAKTTLMCVNDAGQAANGKSSFPSISGNGRYVVFASAATNLVAGDTNGHVDVFVHDRHLKTTKRSSIDWTGTEPSWDCDSPMISGDGRVVGFESYATNLVSGDTNAQQDVFVSGPFLTLEADPAAPAAGATLTFMTWTGAPAAAALLAVTDLNGSSTFLPVVFGNFDGGGRWSFGGTVPNGLSGLVAQFTTYGFVASGKVDASKPFAVSFQ